MNQIILYGFGGARDQYRVMKYFVIFDDNVSIRTIKNEAEVLKIKNPSIEHVYAVDNRRGLKKDFEEGIRQNSIESCAIFKDIIEREGLLIF
jgi:hypothetical protein